ncbi:UNVERIFIED_ORG: ribosome biogenesis protein Tsr3 [Rahnella aquatilis]
MNNQQFRDFLRQNAHIVDSSWNPTDAQLDEIRAAIQRELALGHKVNYSGLQHIITHITGSTRVMIFDSVDNSDLNMLLTSATKKS